MEGVLYLLCRERESARMIKTETELRVEGFVVVLMYGSRASLCPSDKAELTSAVVPAC